MYLIKGHNHRSQTCKTPGSSPWAVCDDDGDDNGVFEHDSSSRFEHDRQDDDDDGGNNGDDGDNGDDGYYDGG